MKNYVRNKFCKTPEEVAQAVLDLKKTYFLCPSLKTLTRWTFILIFLWNKICTAFSSIDTNLINARSNYNFFKCLRHNQNKSYCNIKKKTSVPNTRFWPCKTQDKKYGFTYFLISQNILVRVNSPNKV